MISIREEQKLFREAREIARQYIGKAGVTDVEFGLKHKEGQLTDQIALRFKVDKKKTEKELKRSEILPRKAGKFQTDVLAGSTIQHRVRNEDPKSIVRPLLGGIQIQSGIYTNTPFNWGTLGCLYAVENRFLGFTNYHVLIGGVSPETVAAHYVGKLAVFQNLNHANNRIGTAAGFFSQELDFATFDLKVPFDGIQSINSINGLLTSYGYPRIGMPVMKSGAATGVTYGIIDGRSCINTSELSIHLDPAYPNPDGIVANAGDSGACWIQYDSNGATKLIALHYAGGENLKWAKAKAFSSIFASIRAQ
ncbi:MAG: hypothetical protein V2A67_10645 [Bacteroidota bacterium]